MKAIEILLIEDNAGDIRLFKECLKESKIDRNLHVAEDGKEAMAFLRKEESYTDAHRPDLIILDLNLPRKSGSQVLAEIKGDKTLRSIPVVVFTSSRAQEDIEMAYRLHANCYITKPLNLPQFMEVTNIIQQFWLCVAKLPSGDG